MILLIDNYDSFVHNLARYFRRLGQETVVVRNDAIDLAGVRRLAPAAVVISPGPCSPTEAGCSLEVAHGVTPWRPLLGVCLGHQAIAAAHGARILRAPEPVHGRTSAIRHDAEGIFRGLPNPLTVARYHSLVVDEGSLLPNWQVSARAADGTVMALRHDRFPAVGVQFHPESILTEGGYALLANFLGLAGLPVRPVWETGELVEPVTAAPPLPNVPLTF